MADAREALEVLLQLTRRLTDELALEQALSEVTRAAMALLQGNHASVRLLDESRTELLCGARCGEGADVMPMTFRPGDGVAGWVVAHEAVARVSDVGADPRYLSNPAQHYPVGSIVAVPLWSAGHVVGVLSVSAEAPAAFDEQDELLARLLANCAVPAFEKARLERLAVTDAHTKAFNRRYLLPKLEEEMARSKRTGEPLSLLLMDLDHFKRINDEHGHAEGDQVLREFADRVREATRIQDALVRWGGEEFVLVMPATERDRAVEVAERIRHDVADSPIVLGNGTLIVQTVSVGVATWDGAEAPEAIEARADAAMYAAKRAGRNRVVVSSDSIS